MNIVSVPRTNPKRRKKHTDIKELLDVSRVEVMELGKDPSDDENKIFYQGARHMESRCLFLGGDESISYPLIKALLVKNRPKDVCVFSLSAHAKLTPSSIVPTREESFYALFAQTEIVKENVFFAGIRNLLNDEKRFLDAEGIKYYKDEEADKVSKELVKAGKGKKVYVSLDLSFINLKECPGVICREAGGFCKKDVFFILKELMQKLDIFAIEIVGLNLKNDRWKKTRKVVKEIFHFISQQNRIRQAKEKG